MKRILVVENGDGFGGALTSLEHFLSLVDPARFEIHVLTSYAQDRIRAGGAVRRVGILPRERRYGPKSRLEAALRPVFGRRAGNAAFLVDMATTGRRFAGAVADYARRHQIDLIQGNNGVLINDAVILAARRAGLPCVIHVRGGEYRCRTAGWLAAGVSRILAVSQHVAATVAALGVRADRIVAAPEGLDADAFASRADPAAFRSRHGLPEDLPLVGLVACLVGWKGHDVFLEACATALSRVRAGAVVVGGEPDGSGRELARLRDKAQTLGIGEKVWFTGHEADVASAMAACDVVVHASTSPEPFGRVLLEAMALGRPVVAAGAGGPREVIDAGTDGLLVPPGDAPALTRALLDLLGDAPLRDRLGRAGFRKVRDRYSLAAHVDPIVAVWEETVARRP